MHDAADEIWNRIQAELRAEVTDTTYELWLAPLTAVSYHGDVLLIQAPGPTRGWVTDRFGPTLDHAAKRILGPHATIQIDGEGQPKRTGAARGPRNAQSLEPEATASSWDPRDVAGPTGGPSASPTGSVQDLNPNFTFNDFILGEHNRFAHAAALAVAELPGHAYNPLFLYGPPGVGKTHLLHSIGNYVRAYGGGSVRCTTAEAFTNAFLGALHGGNVDRFKERFRGVDVLLIDDVQFLESKARTEEEFFHTFNALHDAGSQVVLTSDRLPSDLAALEDRLRERFEAGLVADILPPDRATRMTVLRKRVHQDGIDLADPAALDVIADRITGNVRALEGALIRIVAYHSLTGRPLDAALAEEVLAGLYPGVAGSPAPRGQRAPTVELIQSATCELFGLTRDELLSESRSQRVTWPRQLAMFLAREHTRESLPAIGAAFGGRNHTTVMHACKRAAERVAADPEASDTVRTLSERLHADRPD